MDLHPDKNNYNSPLSQVSRKSEVYQEFLAKIMEIKVIEINGYKN